MYQKRIPTLFCLFLAITLYSCKHNTQVNIDDLDEVYFDTQIQPIFSNSCAYSGCHDGGKKFSLATYEDIMRHGVKAGKPEDSEIYEVLTGGEELMPPDNPLPVEQRNLIYIWIKQGALNNTDPNGGSTGGGGEIPNPTEPDTTMCFEVDILPIFVSNCTTSGCHNSQDRRDGYDLSTYEGIMAKDDGIRPGNPNDSEIIEVIKLRTNGSNDEDAMPPSPYAAVSQEDLDKIIQWVNEGAKNEDCTTTTDCDPTAFDYVTDIQPIFETHCIGCHGANSPSGGVSLVTQAQQEAIAKNGVLIHVVEATGGYPQMPTAYRLSDCNIEQLKAWSASLN